jgi:hypothetical protein
VSAPRRSAIFSQEEFAQPTADAGAKIVAQQLTFGPHTK